MSTNDLSSFGEVAYVRYIERMTPALQSESE